MIMMISMKKYSKRDDLIYKDNDWEVGGSSCAEQLQGVRSEGMPVLNCQSSCRSQFMVIAKTCITSNDATSPRIKDYE